MMIILLFINYYLAFSTSKKAPILDSKYVNNEKYSQLFAYDLKSITQYFLLHHFTFHSESNV